MVTILVISAKFAAPGLLKLNIFQNKDYDVIILDNDVTNKSDPNYIVDVLM